MAQQLKVGGLDDLDYSLDQLHLKVVIPFKQHSFNSLQLLKDSDEELEISLSTRGTIINTIESIRLYKCKGRMIKLERHQKGAEAIFELDAAPEFSTITL